MNSRINIAKLFLLVALLPGCALVGPDYQRPESEMPAQYSEQDAGKESNAMVSDKWWELYQDPVLNDLVELARKNNTDVKLAVARIEEADAFLREAGATLFPEVDLNASASRSKVTQLGSVPTFNNFKAIRNDYVVQLGSTFEVDFWGKFRRTREAARAQALATRYAKDTVQWSLSGLVASNYILMRSLEAQITVSQDSLRSRQESLALTKRRLEGGVASALDVHQAQVSASNLQAQIADLIRQRQIVEHQLAVLTGVLDLDLPESDLKHLPLPPVPPAGLPSQLLEARPDIQQAEQQMVSANARIGVAKAALFPSISLTGVYGGESAELGDILKSAARIWTLGIGLDLPIFDAGTRTARVDEATAQQKQALAQYEGAIQTAFKEVNDALVTLRQSAERESALAVSQESAAKALQIAENRYKSGYAGYLEVLDAQRVHNDLTLSYIQSRQDRLTATVDLFKALGGGWTPERQQAAAASSESE
ncbi:MAG TPA: efflux transporter outer membrane subunit [Methylophilaceae bacterium]|nr:efflux transporter outer membrane subunit [Methylophilaceae bacterium]